MTFYVLYAVPTDLPTQKSNSYSTPSQSGTMNIQTVSSLGNCINNKYYPVHAVNLSVHVCTHEASLLQKSM